MAGVPAFADVPRSELLQSASWPGVQSCESCEYVCSHGITPGRWVMVTYPQKARPAEFGDLAFSDGRRTVVIRNCKVDRITPRQGPEGTSYVIEGLDERWQWPGLGGVQGHFNEKDDRQKLVPWTIRSPQELAYICLSALGIKSATINLPQGLSSAIGKNVDRYLRLGENFPQTQTNPEVVWDHTPPAEALAQLADTYGCRVIYQPNAVRVLVTPIGKGAPLPAGAYESVAATVDSPEAPAYVGVYGSPIKWQMKLLLEAVGEEWDGSIVPINQLSYSPVKNRRPQVSRVQEFGDGAAMSVAVTLDYTGANGRTLAIAITSTGGTNEAKFATIAQKMKAFPEVAALFKVVPDATGVTFTLKRAGTFGLYAHDGVDQLAKCGFANTVLIQAGGLGTACWANSNPPIFFTVQATDRLSYSEAVAKARKSVFKWYRVLNQDIHDKFERVNPAQPRRPLKPVYYEKFFGALKRRQQIIIQDTKVEQVVPMPRIPGAINKDNAQGNANPNIPGQGVLPEFYNGYSRSQANTVTGSIAMNIGYANWLFAIEKNNKRFNTNTQDRVFVDFDIDKREQVVRFSDHVYYWVGGGLGNTIIQEPVLTLECGCYLLHPENNQVLRWEETMKVGGVAPTEWIYREDIEVGIVTKYTGLEKDRIDGFNFFDLPDAKARALYYLRGAAAKYIVHGGETRQYIGIMPHDLDGYTQQITWKVGEGGPTTIISANTEHHPAVPPYTVRRRAEQLAPNQAAAAANLLERELLIDFSP